MVVVFLDSGFEAQAPEERLRVYAELQDAAARAGLAGSVAAIWQDARKCTRFIAQPQQHRFFQVTNFAQLRAQISEIPLAVETDKKR